MEENAADKESNYIRLDSPPEVDGGALSVLEESAREALRESDEEKGEAIFELVRGWDVLVLAAASHPRGAPGDRVLLFALVLVWLFVFDDMLERVPGSEDGTAAVEKATRGHRPLARIPPPSDGPRPRREGEGRGGKKGRGCGTTKTGTTLIRQAPGSHIRAPRSRLQ